MFGESERGGSGGGHCNKQSALTVGAKKTLPCGDVPQGRGERTFKEMGWACCHKLVIGSNSEYRRVGESLRTKMDRGLGSKYFMPRPGLGPSRKVLNGNFMLI